MGTAAGVALTASTRVLKARGPVYPENSTLSFAQTGEDVIASFLFEHLKVEKPTYLDIGAFLPIFASNTYLFYSKGSRGVLVEPNVDLIPELRARRPGDTVLNVGIGLNDESSAEYYCLTDPQWNTFDKAAADNWVKKGQGSVKIEKTVKMPLVPINRILAEHFPNKAPDFLSIDIESLDLAVLRTLDFERFRPRVICSETLVAATYGMNPETTKFLATKGYEARAVTWANTLYVDRSLLG